MVEASHLDEGKVQLQHILAMPGLDQVALVGEYGFRKYGDRWNYRKGMPWSKLLGSCSRHLAAFIRGQNLDNESGLPHLAHLAYDCLMLLEYMESHNAQDDRYKTHAIGQIVIPGDILPY
jgi:Domain of unknown function (DUF5664)